MNSHIVHRSQSVVVGTYRLVCGLSIFVILVYAYILRIVEDDGNPFNYFGYFTNQTGLLASVVFAVTGALNVSGRRVGSSLILLRGITTAYLLVVAVIYNVLVPGTGSAPQWVSILFHVVFPLIVALDWLLIGDRPPLAWRTLWFLLPYPILWLATVLIRGATDGWVPYGFLLPERGLTSLVVHVGALLAAIMIAGALVWTASRFHGADAGEPADARPR